MTDVLQDERISLRNAPNARSGWPAARHSALRSERSRRAFREPTRSEPLDLASLDPFAEGRGDRFDAVTDRQALRVAIVSAEVGARFAREGVAHDPVAWMLAPRILFDGACALTACRDVGAFSRAMVLHGLGLGLDADPEAVDVLMEDEGDEEDDGDDLEFADDDGAIGLECGKPPLGWRPFAADAAAVGGVEGGEPELRLFTAFVDAGSVCAFCAVVADDPGGVHRRLAARYGESGFGAEVVEGFDGDDVRVRAIASPATIGLVRQVAADPESSRGFDLAIERRLA